MDDSICTEGLILVSSADNLCKQFGPSKLFNTLMVFLKEIFENLDFEKSADDKNIAQYANSLKAKNKKDI